MTLAPNFLIFRRFWVALGNSGASFGSVRAPSGAMGVIFCSLDRLCMAPGPTFGRHFSKSSTFVILIPLCSGIGGFRGLAVQVGATWSIKSHPGDARGSQNGGQGGQKGAGSGQSGRPVEKTSATQREPGQTQVRPDLKTIKATSHMIRSS